MGLWGAAGRRRPGPASRKTCEQSNHSKRQHVGLQDRLLLRSLVLVLLAQTHDRTQRLDVEAVALCLRVNVANVVGDSFLLLLKTFDTLNEGLEMVLRNQRFGLLLFDGSGSAGGHDTPHESSGSPSTFGGARVTVKAPERLVHSQCSRLASDR